MKTTPLSLLLAFAVSIILGTLFHFRLLPFFMNDTVISGGKPIPTADFSSAVSLVLFGFSGFCLILAAAWLFWRSLSVRLGRRNREGFLTPARLLLTSYYSSGIELERAPNEYLMQSPDGKTRLKCVNRDMLGNEYFELSGPFGSIIFTGILEAAKQPPIWHVRNIAYRTADGRAEVILRNTPDDRLFTDAARRSLISYGTFCGDDSGGVEVKFVNLK